MHIRYSYEDERSVIEHGADAEDVEVSLFIGKDHFKTNTHDFLGMKSGNFNIPISKLENKPKLHFVAAQGNDRANATIDSSKINFNNGRER